MRYVIGALLALAVFCGPAEALEAAADAPSLLQPASGQSLFFFAGRTSPTNLEDTAAFNLTRSRGTASYDNAIVGAAYQRDFLQIGRGVFLGGEIGIANRFGYYKVCCDPTVRTSDVIHSGELWGGGSLRYEGITLFNALRVSPGFVGGLSAITNPIGQEALHQKDGKSARLLFYLGFETAFSLPEHPNAEVVLRLHHRSGAYGTLGGLKEGNNATVVGFRQRV